VGYPCLSYPVSLLSVIFPISLMRTKVSFFREIRFSYTCAFQGLMKHCLNYTQPVLIHVCMYIIFSLPQNSNTRVGSTEENHINIRKKAKFIEKAKNGLAVIKWFTCYYSLIRHRFDHSSLARMSEVLLYLPA
jgi:hypothetical protein